MPAPNPISLMLRELRRAVKGHPNQIALESYTDVASSLDQLGYPTETVKLIDEGLRKFAGAPKASVAWALKTKGIALHRLARFSEADRCLRAARRIGATLSDPHIEGAAEFALGSLCQTLEDLARCRAHYAAAYPLLRQAGDHYALVLILQNITTLNIDEGALDRAHETIGITEPLIRASCDPHLLANQHALFGYLIVHMQ